MTIEIHGDYVEEWVLFFFKNAYKNIWFTYELPTYYTMSSCSLLILNSKYCIPFLIFRFEKANELLIGLMKAISAKHWNEAQVYGQCARKHFKTLIEDSTLT
jgi:hypothetical protein